MLKYVDENIEILTPIIIYLIKYYNVFAILQFSQFVCDGHSLSTTAHYYNLSFIRKTGPFGFYVTSELKF